MTLGSLTIEQPWWLLLPVLSLPMLWLPDQPSALPGSWSAVVHPTLSQHLTNWIPVSQPRKQVLLILIVISLLSGALAGVGFGSHLSEPERALHGRLLVIDASPEVPMNAPTYIARQIAHRSSDTPTGVIVVAADAFDVVPLTEDPAQIERYLSVFEPSMMPALGRELGRGIARARAALERSRVLAYQIVLLTDGQAPAELPTLAKFDGRLRIVTAGAPDPSWTRWAAHLGAVVSGPESLAELDAALLQDQQTVVADATPVETRRGLTPWFIAACLPAWLALFFRRGRG